MSNVLHFFCQSKIYLVESKAKQTICVDLLFQKTKKACKIIYLVSSSDEYSSFFSYNMISYELSSNAKDLENEEKKSVVHKHKRPWKIIPFPR